MQKAGYFWLSLICHQKGWLEQDHNKVRLMREGSKGRVNKSSLRIVTGETLVTNLFSVFSLPMFLKFYEIVKKSCSKIWKAQKANFQNKTTKSQDTQYYMKLQRSPIELWTCFH